MPRLTVYLDTTIPSMLLEDRPDPLLQTYRRITEKWWESERARFEVFVSETVIQELGAGEPDRAARRLESVADFPLLKVTAQVAEAAQYYIDQMAMPRRNVRDAFHLACASVHDIDYLLTWNFAHLANAFKRQHLEVLNRRMHLSMPFICTPEELIRE